VQASLVLPGSFSPSTRADHANAVVQDRQHRDKTVRLFRRIEPFPHGRDTGPLSASSQRFGRDGLFPDDR